MPTAEIINGDCLTKMREMSDKSVDLIFTSPPYNMRTRIRNGKYTTREKADHFSKKYQHFDDALPIETFFDFHKNCIAEMLRISKVVVYNFQIVTGSKEAFFRLIGHYSQDIKDIMIWDKSYGQPAMHENILNSAYELILILEDDKKCGRMIQNATFKRGTLDNILRIGRERKKFSGHSATFPLKLAETIIINFSKEGNIILDPFMGTGTTGVAAKKLNRNFIGIDISEEYYNIAKERLEKA